MSENKEGQQPIEDVVSPTEEIKEKTNIEKYNEKRKTEVKEDIESAEDRAEAFRDELIETLKSRADKRTLTLIKSLDKDSQLVVLKENEKQNLKNPMPNMPGIPNPVGAPKIGLAKYMKFVPGSDKISWEIPATVLLDPEKNKKLGEYV